MRNLFHDFETYSEANLKEFGSEAYAAHPSTRILCVGWYCPETCGRGVWDVKNGDDAPSEFVELINDPDVQVHAFNVAFERMIWKYRGMTDLGLETPKDWRWHDTMALAATQALPLSLADLGERLELAEQKDDRGGMLIDLHCKPGFVVGKKRWRQLQDMFPDLPDEPKLPTVEGREWRAEHSRCDTYHYLKQYCLQDVITEAEAHKALLPLSARERRLWLLDQKINMLGIRIDSKAMRKAIELVEYEAELLDREIERITDGEVKSGRSPKQMLAWLHNHGLGQITDMQAETVADNLKCRELTPLQRRVLEIRADVSSSAVAKLYKMRDCQGDGERVRYTTQFHAASTGRWAGRLVQPQNMPRPTLHDPDFTMLHSDLPTPALGECLRYLHGGILPFVTSTLRGMFIPGDGMVFCCADYSSIEAVVLACLAGEEWKIQKFRDIQAGLIDDIYCATASVIFGYEVKKDTHPNERKIGKIGELASGYQGAVGAWNNFGADKLGWTDDQILAEVYKWRGKHPATCAMWGGVERAALSAVRTPGTVYRYRSLAFRCDTERQFLRCRLPSGRVLYYFRPTIEEGRFGNPQVCYWATKQLSSGGRTWTHIQGYGGMFTENIVQGVSRDLMADAMLRVDDELPEYQIVLTVHDELLTEVADYVKFPRILEDTMAVLPEWAEGWPIKAEGWVGDRYRKA